jgi:hypothetical protein
VLRCNSELLGQVTRQLILLQQALFHRELGARAGHERGPRFRTENAIHRALIVAELAQPYL